MDVEVEGVEINDCNTLRKGTPPPWQGIIGTMRCCVLDNYKRKHNMVPTVIEQDDFILFYDIKWYPQVSLIEKTTHHKTSKSLGDMFY